MTEASAPAAPLLPVEDPGRGFWQGLLPSVRALIVEPVRAYQGVPPRGPLGRALGYAVVLGWAAMFVSYFWGLVFRMGVLGALWQFGDVEEVLPTFFFQALGEAVWIALGPVWIMIGLFVWAAIVHLLLFLLGGAHEGFAATFKVGAYAQTASLGQMIPLVGGFVAAIWSMVLTILGLVALHRAAAWQAVLAVLLPVVVCCACGITLAILIGVLAAQG